MSDLLRWPNVEKAMVAYLRSLNVSVYTETRGVMPGRYLRIERVGGGAHWISRDVSIEIRAVAETRRALCDLVSGVESLMDALAANEAAPGIYIDDVATPFGIAWAPPDNQQICAAIGTFTLTVRPTV